MQLSVSCEILLKALQQVSGVVEKRQTKPILSHVLLSISPSRATLTATDLELTLIANLELCDIEETFDVALPARKLMDICKALPKSEVMHFVFQEQAVKITTQTTKFSVKILPAAEFPVLDETAAILECHLPEQGLLTLLNRTQTAMAQQDVRAYLNGILFDIDNEQLRCVATDGHRLALASHPLVVQGAAHRVILPRKAILELCRVLEDQEQEVQISFSKQHVRFAFANLVLITQLIEGRFPDFEKVLPRQRPQPLYLDKEQLRETLLRIAVLSNERYKGVRWVLQTDSLHVSASNPEQELAEETLAIDYQGETLDIGFNVNYVLEALQILPENSQWHFKDAHSSVLITADNMSYVLMPMRL